MAYTAIPASGDLGQIDTGESIESFPSVPLLTGLNASLKEGLATAPTNETFYKIKRYLIENTDAGESLAPEAIKERYPDVADQFPNGGARNLVELANHRQSNVDVRHTLMDNMPQGTLATGAKYATMMVGGALDPIGMVAAKGLTALGSMGGRVLESAIVTRFGEDAMGAKLAGRALVGFGEGAGVTAPYAASSYEFYKDLNKDVDIQDYIPMMLIGGGLGGLIRGITGFGKIVPQDAINNILETMHDQAENGKKVNVEPIIKQAVYEQSRINAKEEGIAPEELAARQDEMRTQSKQIEEQIEKTQKDYKNAKSSISIDAASREGAPMLDMATNLSGIADKVRTPEQNGFLKTMPKTDEFHSALALNKLKQENLIPPEREFLNKFKNGNEKELTQDGIEDKNKELEKVGRQLDKIDKEKNPEKFDELTAKKNSLTERIARSQERIKELDEIEKESPNAKELRKQYQDQVAQHADLIERLKNTEAYDQLMDTAQPIDKNDLQAEVNKQDSFKGEETFDKKIYEDAEQMIKKPDIDVGEANKELDNTFKKLDQANKLTEEETSILNDIAERKAARGKLRKALDELADCLTGSAK